ncbi:MAG: YncE family protein [Planctomycetes bacterium]|nr:YncE family protein [Planctomycetota bacterium]
MRIAALAGALALAVLRTPAPAQNGYVNFESPTHRPIALSADKTRLFVVNTADARLSVFDVTNPSQPILLKEIAVGIEPVAVQPRTADEVWVANHTSDSVSVVSVSQGIVTDTIQAKDEPCDIVFAGTPQRAYVTASRSNKVLVFDATSHALTTEISIFAESPRQLAASADGTKVYASAALSGNRTTIVPHTQAPAQPNISGLPTSPDVALIVDATNPTYSPSVIKYTMPDNDVAEINTATNTVSRYFTRTGTLNHGIAVQPGSGDLFVANTDALNLVFYEPALRGHMTNHRISRINIVSGAVTSFDLNPGINYAVLPNPAALSTALSSLTDAVFDPSGSFLWVAAFGTDRVAKVSSSGAVLSFVEVGNATGAAADPRNKRGPRGLALNATASRLYVSNRISNTISVVDTASGVVIRELPVGAFDPTPTSIRTGRGFLYDHKLSGNGTAACSSCHLDGDFDMLAWDLGDPNGTMQTVTDPTGLFGNIFQMHPMKGPMVTQTLKGLAGNQNPLHWRGDRADFAAFNPAFDGLLGGSQLAGADMTAFKDFVETMKFEPNPNQRLDRTLPTSLPGFAGNPQTGQSLFLTNFFQPLLTCNTCHIQNTGGQTAAIIPGAILQDPQDFNIPHLRNMYMKMSLSTAAGTQSRAGFGIRHDGIFATIFDFLGQPVFGSLQSNTTNKNHIQAFSLCFDTGMAPAVGYSRTALQANANLSSLTSDITLLQSQAQAGNIDLIVKGVADGAVRGFTYQPGSGNYKSDRTGYGPFTWAQLQTKLLAGGATLTFMGVPPGTGNRMGIDRNANGVLDGDENAGALASYGTPSPACAGAIQLGGNSVPSIGNGLFALTCTGAAPSTLSLGIVTSLPDNAGTPFLGFTLWVNLASPEVITLDMPADASGFAYGPAPIPNNAALIGVQYHGEVITLAPCAPFGLGASHGLHITISAP